MISYPLFIGTCSLTRALGEWTIGEPQFQRHRVAF